MGPEAYEPPAIEGENAGLIEQVAARLWRNRSVKAGVNAGRNRALRPGFDEQSQAVRVSWRETARDLLTMLLSDMGFEGPAGPPRDPHTGWSYAWLEQCNEWEIIDDAGGLVALVGHSADLQMLLAAPRMREAIEGLLDAINGTPALQRPEIENLANALPKRNDPPPA